MGSGSAVAIALLGGCMQWAALELLGGTRTPSAPIRLIFWESPWGRAGAGSGGVERLVGMARVWRALCWGKAMQRGFGASCLGRTWSGPQGSLLALLLLCITDSLGKPLCGATAPAEGWAASWLFSFCPLTRCVPLSALTLLGCSRPTAAAPRHAQEVPRAGRPWRLTRALCLLLGLLAARIAAGCSSPVRGSCRGTAGWCFALGHTDSARDRQASIVNFQLMGTTATAELGGAPVVKQKGRKPSPKGLDLPQS